MKDIWTGRVSQAAGRYAEHTPVVPRDGADDLLGVVDVDVAEEGEAEEAHRLLAVDQQDDPAAALPFDLVHQPDARTVEHFLPQPGL